MKQRTYIAIDLKSFYASVECLERGLDPMTTNLVVADSSRTEKTICLAVSPSLKSFGIPGRPRLFEVVQKVNMVNAQRKQFINGQNFSGDSYNYKDLKLNPKLSVSYIVAPPRMALYIDYSTKIYNVYLKYIAPEDMHIYSIDEVFIDVTNYLETYKLSAHDLAMKIILDVLNTTGITATAGIGTNLYLCKIAMDIGAKHIPADKNGVRIAELNEITYRKLLWNHRPLTDFWRVGKGYAKKLEDHGLYTMGDIAKCSIGKSTDFYNEDLLYKLFGINAELLIDHAWGWEPCTISDVKSYKPSTNSLCSGQVLQDPYSCEKARIVVREMIDSLSMDLLDKSLVTNQIVLTIGYDIESLKNMEIRQKYTGEITKDAYGRNVPKPAHGTQNINRHTSSLKILTDNCMCLFDKIINPDLLVRRITITANNVISEQYANTKIQTEQLDLFTDYTKAEITEKQENEFLEKEKKLQQAILSLKKKYGKNAVLKGVNFQDGATMMERNGQIGGHKA